MKAGPVRYSTQKSYVHPTSTRVDDWLDSCYNDDMMHAFTVGPQGDLFDPEGSWATTYGVEQDGAVLVRPDGHVAWRSRSNVTNPAQALQGILASMLGKMTTRKV